MKIYSISLLLTFLLVLSHDMIPHHHHDVNLDMVSSIHKNSNPHSHHSEADHHHHDFEHKHDHSEENDEEHEHRFPLHFHVVAAKDYNQVRQVVNGSDISKLNSIVNLYSFNRFGEFAEPPNFDFIRYTDLPFLINTIFEPGAISLRAPPCIA